MMLVVAVARTKLKGHGPELWGWARRRAGLEAISPMP